MMSRGLLYGNGVPLIYLSVGVFSHLVGSWQKPRGGHLPMVTTAPAHNEGEPSMETQNPESRHFTVARRFEKELENAARKYSAHRNHSAAAEPDWYDTGRVMIRAGTAIPSHLMKPRARTIEQLILPKPFQTGWRAHLAGALAFCVLAIAGWISLGRLWDLGVIFLDSDWSNGPGSEPPFSILKFLIVPAFVLLCAHVLKRSVEQWRLEKIAEDANAVIRGREPFLDEIFLPEDLDQDSHELLTSYLRSPDVRSETVWAVAHLLLESDVDRRELSRYKTLLPTERTPLDPAHPLHEVLETIQERFNTRMQKIAGQVADDVAAAARISEAAR
jgi:hypothetical protein